MNTEAEKLDHTQHYVRVKNIQYRYQLKTVHVQFDTLYFDRRPHTFEVCDPLGKDKRSLFEIEDIAREELLAQLRYWIECLEIPL